MNDCKISISKSEILKIILLSYSAGQDIGMAKVKTQALMSDVGKGVGGEFAGIDAPLCYGSKIGINYDPDHINLLSQRGVNELHKLCDEYGIARFIQ